MRKFYDKSKLPRNVIIGLILGIFTGLILGKSCKYLEPIGQIYTMLLEAAVYPYIISALILSLASLSTPVTKRILRKSWRIYLLFIFVCFTMIYIISESIPASASNIILEPTANHFLYKEFIAKIIPKNFFNSLSNNDIPAIILFCCIFGLSLQNAKHVEPLLQILSAIKHGCLVLWNALVYISPVAVFSMVSYTIGNTDLVNLKSLLMYILLMAFTCITLGFIILPLLISCFIDIPYKKVLKIFKEAIVISLSTSLVVAAIPYIEQEIKEYLLNAKDSFDNEDSQTVSTIVAVCYPIGLVGNFCIFIFIIFAATYYQTPISQYERFPLLVLTYFASIGSPSSAVSAIEFLGSWQHLPLTATDIYVELTAITRYFQVAASTMGVAFLGITICVTVFDKSSLQLKKLFFYIIFSIASLSLASFIINRIVDGKTIQGKTLLDFDLDLKYKKVKVQFGNATGEPIDSMSNAIKRIQKSGVIRVGYNPTMIPFTYFNRKNALVGYDVTYIYELANDLGIKIQFIPFEYHDLVNDIKNRKFDIAIGSIIVSPERLLEVSFTKPTFIDTIAFLVKRGEEKDFMTIQTIDSAKVINVGVINTDFLLKIASLNFPNNKIEIIQDKDRKIDEILEAGSLLWTYSHAAAIARIYPGYGVIIPGGMIGGGQVLMAFVINKEDDEFRQYLNYWLDIKASDGFQQKQYKRWILGEETLPDK